jgi:hypothetical protein
MPDRAEQAAIKLREIQDSVPIPERVWALRNVGSTSAMGGPEGRSRARKLLDQAIALKLELVGGIKHPGVTYFTVLDPHVLGRFKFQKSQAHQCEKIRGTLCGIF